MSVSVENVLDKIAELLIENFQTVQSEYGINLEDTQKTIRFGEIVVGVDDKFERLVLYQNDTEANLQELRALGYTVEMMSLESGVHDYVHYLQGDAKV